MILQETPVGLYFFLIELNKLFGLLSGVVPHFFVQLGRFFLIHRAYTSCITNITFTVHSRPQHVHHEKIFIFVVVLH